MVRLEIRVVCLANFDSSVAPNGVKGREYHCFIKEVYTAVYARHPVRVLFLIAINLQCLKLMRRELFISGTITTGTGSSICFERIFSNFMRSNLLPLGAPGMAHCG